MAVWRQRSTDSGADPIVIGTGGLVDVVANQTTVFSVIDRDLTLQGLRLLGELNS